MGASVTTGLQMAAARPCIPACQRLLGSRAALPSFARALSTQTGFASCRKTASAGPFVSLNHKRFAVRAMSAQGLPIDLRGKLYASQLKLNKKKVRSLDFGAMISRQDFEWCLFSSLIMAKNILVVTNFC